MATTYEAIATVTVGSGGAANIEFTSIPATFTDLVILLSSRSSRSDASTFDPVYMTFNGNGSNYSARNLYGNGAAAYSDTQGSTDQFYYAAYAPTDTATASTFGNVQIYIPNYAGSNNKSVNSDSVTENNGTNHIANMAASLWSNTSAITSIKLDPGGGDFKQYSTATLYGIKSS
jgi:hypothetical protein